MRQPISNEAFSAARMYAKALRGDYPSAERRSKHRDGELVYWRQRCEAEGVDVAAIERANKGRSGRR